MGENWKKGRPPGVSVWGDFSFFDWFFGVLSKPISGARGRWVSTPPRSFLLGVHFLFVFFCPRFFSSFFPADLFPSSGYLSGSFDIIHGSTPTVIPHLCPTRLFFDGPLPSYALPPPFLFWRFLSPVSFKKKPVVSFFSSSLIRPWAFSLALLLGKKFSLFDPAGEKKKNPCKEKSCPLFPGWAGFLESLLGPPKSPGSCLPHYAPPENRKSPLIDC